MKRLPSAAWVIAASAIGCVIVAFASGRAGSTLGVGLAFLALAGLVVAAAARRYRGAAIALAVAFALRAGAALVQAATHGLPDSTMDAVTFDATAWQWAGDFANIGSHFTLEAYLYSWLLAFPYALFGHSDLMAQSINVLLGTLIVLNVFLLARELWDERAARRAAWVAALWPSLILYSAILLREAAYVYPLTLGAFLLARWFNDPRARWLILSALAFGLAAWFHRGAVPALLVMLAVPTFAAARAIYRRRRQAVLMHTGHALAACFVAALMVSPLVGASAIDRLQNIFQAKPEAPATDPPVVATTVATPPANQTPPPARPSNTTTNETPSEPPATTTPPPSTTPSTTATPAAPVLTSNDFSGDALAARQASSADARSAYLTWLPMRSLSDAAWQAPIRAFYFLFSPMPWNFSAIKDVVGFADALLYAGVAVLLWRGRGEIAANPAAIALLLTALVLIVVYADNTFNAGTALRHRAKFAPLLIALVPGEFARKLRPEGPRRVLHVVNAPESFLQNRLPIAKKAREEGYDVQVAGPDGPGARQIANLGFRYHVITLDRRSTNAAKEALTLVALFRLYRRIRPDVVHHFTIKPVIYGGIAARFARVPACVHTITGLGYVFTSHDLRARVLGPVVSLAYVFAFDHPNGVVVFQNRDDEAQLVSSGVALTSRSALIPGSGVDLAAFPVEPAPSGAPLVVLPARLLRDKGVVEFVDAARRLRASGARFALVGDVDEGNPASLSRTEVEAWAKEGVVEWWGWRTDMQRVYVLSSIVCLPSYREGLPKALLEAAATRRALVATDAPGCREVVVDGESGLLVPTRDPAALAAALSRLLGDAELRTRLARGARERAESRFGTEIVAASYLATYERALGGLHA